MFEWLFGSRSEEIPDWYTRDQQMRDAQSIPPTFSGQQAWFEYEQRMMVKARDLAGDQHPAYNIAPLLDLVKQADRLGFDVVRRS